MNRHCGIIKFILLGVVCISLLPVSVHAQKHTEFIPGEVWKDTDGNPNNAHGGGLLYHNGTYYWYGEYKKGKNWTITIGYVQPIGEKAIPGQVVDANSTSSFGVGAFLLAACERVRYLNKYRHGLYGFHSS